MHRVSRLFALSLALGSLACSVEPRAELLRLEELEGDELEVGRALVVRGQGLPSGREGRLVLRGRHHRPGERPRDVTLDLRAEATGPTRALVPVERSRLEALRGRGTFRGELELAFPTADGDAEVFGRLEGVALDVLPSGSVALERALTDQRRATRLSTELGLELGESAAGDGLPISAVEEGSAAAELGLIVGDQLIELDGARLRTLADLIPAPGESPRLRVRREGEVAPFEVRLPPARASGPELDPNARLAAQAGLAWLWLCLFVGPGASWLERLVRRRPPEAKQPRGRQVARALGLLLVAAVPSVIGLGVSMPLEGVVAAGLLARLVAAGWADGRTWARRSVAVLGAAPAALAVVVATLGAMLWVGTTDAAHIRAAQGALPWEWSWVAAPFGPLLLGLWLWGVVSMPTPRGRGPERMDLTGRLLLAGAAAILWLGGGRLDGWPPLVEGLLLALEAGALFALARPRSLSSSWRARALGGLASLTLAASISAWIWRRPPEALERALSEVTLVALGLALLLIPLLAWRASRAPASAPPHPFA